MSKKEEPKDTTKSHLNSKAQPITYPKGEDISPVVLKEKATIELHFDDTKKLEKAQKLCKVLQEIHDLENQKKQSNDQFSQQIKAKEIEQDDLANAIRKGFEEKELLCDVVRNFGTGKREYHYQGKKYKEEPLRKSDHQLDIELAEKKNKSEAKVVKFDIKLKAGDWIKTIKGNIIELTEEDIITLDYSKVERLATQEEINQKAKK